MTLGIPVAVVCESQLAQCVCVSYLVVSLDVSDENCQVVKANGHVIVHILV